jgi:hypothetical protein
MNNPKCPRGGGQDLLELDQHYVKYSKKGRT